MTSDQDPRSGWNRLEDSLLTIKPGEEITVDHLVSQTGLSRTTIERVLEELAHSELFQKKAANVFVRRSLWETAAGEPRRRFGPPVATVAVSHARRMTVM